MKKMTVLVLVAMLVSLSAMAVAQQLCSVSGCNESAEHMHNGTRYAGHTTNDGHTYHALCTVQNCNIAGTHEHDGTTHLPHHSGDGHSYHSNASQQGSRGGHNSGHRGGKHH